MYTFDVRPNPGAAAACGGFSLEWVYTTMTKLDVRHLDKVHDDPDCESLLWVTRYLWSVGFDARPGTVRERNFPEGTVLPTIVAGSTVHAGLPAILRFYGSEIGLSPSDLLAHANNFRRQVPGYRMSDTKCGARFV